MREKRQKRQGGNGDFSRNRVFEIAAEVFHRKGYDNTSMSDVAAARAKLVQLLDKMEEALQPSGWLVGKAYSIADIAAVPFVKRIDEEIAPDEMPRHAHVNRWWSAVQARPAFVRANIGPFLNS